MVSLSCISGVDGNFGLGGDIVAGLREDNKTIISQQQAVCLPESDMYSVEFCFTLSAIMCV